MPLNLSDSVATAIEVAWADGLTQRFERQNDGTWTLTLGGPVDGGPRVTGYRRADLERVLGRVIDGTAEGNADG